MQDQVMLPRVQTSALEQGKADRGEATAAP
jgi:hypothetical protein